MATYEEFKKLSFRIGRIKEAVDHPNADKLYVVKVDIGGEEMEVVAGIKKAYNIEDLKGKLVVVIDNLEPAIIRGVESKGMILAASNGEEMSIIAPDKEIAPGSIVK